MSHSGVRDRLDRAVAIAQRDCTSLRGRNITPHTLRHSTAMHPTCSSPEPIWRRSPCGSDTQAPPSPTNTSRQTSRPRKPCYNTSTTPVPHQHVSSPTTNSSPSSKTCDYVQRLPVDRRPQRGPPTGLHITMDWAEWVMSPTNRTPGSVALNSRRIRSPAGGVPSALVQ